MLDASGSTPVTVPGWLVATAPSSGGGEGDDAVAGLVAAAAGRFEFGAVEASVGGPACRGRGR